MDEALLDKMVSGIGVFSATEAVHWKAQRFFKESLHTIRSQLSTSNRDQIMAKMLVELGLFWDQTGRLLEAEAILEEADALCQQQNLTRTHINCLRLLGVVTDHQGKQDRRGWRSAAAISIRPSFCSHSSLNTPPLVEQCVTMHRILEELAAELPPGIISNTETAVQSHTLDSLIEQLVNE